MRDISSERLDLEKTSAIFSQPQINTDGHGFINREPRERKVKNSFSCISRLRIERAGFPA
jgi:hypothetical protein